MKKNLLLIGVQLIMISLVVAWYQVDKKKMAYVEISKVYNAFDLQKELSSNYTHIQQTRQNMIDSMKIALEANYRELKEKSSEDKIRNFENKRTLFIQKQEQFEQENQQILEKYDKQIWTQLNQYIKDYGDFYGYDYIYGANGNGTMMYANDSNEISQDLILFVNEKFHGKSK